MDIKLDGDAVQSIASAAIFEHLGQEARDSIIKDAIAHLITPTKDTYGRPGSTPLQEAFNRGIESAAQRVVFDHVKDNPEIEAQIKELLGPIMTQVLNKRADHWDSSLAEAVGNAFGSWINERSRDSWS